MEWGKSEIQINLEGLEDQGRGKGFSHIHILSKRLYICWDKRGCTDFIPYFQDLLYYRDKFIVYVNNLRRLTLDSVKANWEKRGHF